VGKVNEVETVGIWFYIWSEMNKNITAMVYTLNEEQRLPLVYENLKDFCQLIVFDGGSTDGTEDFCRLNGIKFVVRPADNSYLNQESLKWVYSNIPTEYVLHVFGAHFFPNQLLSYFANVADENKLDAVYHDLVVYRYGEVVHRPLFRRISSACNFYKKNIITFENSILHNERGLSFNEKTMIRLPGRDELALHLFQDEDCESYAKKTTNYAVIEAKQRFDRGERVGFSGLFFKPFGRFIYRYIRAGSIARGRKGLVYAVMNFVYDINMSIMIWELGSKLTYVDAIRKNDEKKRQLLRQAKLHEGFKS
jgi:glycosyltransferase involved in cell wall biosynthesis